MLPLVCVVVVVAIDVVVVGVELGTVDVVVAGAVGVVVAAEWLAGWNRSSKPTTTSAVTTSPSTTRSGQLGSEPPRFRSFAIFGDGNSVRHALNRRDR